MIKRHFFFRAKGERHRIVVWNAMVVFIVAFVLIVPSMATLSGVPDVAADSRVLPATFNHTTLAAASGDRSLTATSNKLVPTAVGSRQVPTATAVFPGLRDGAAAQRGNQLELTFPYPHENPVFLEGRAARIPITFGENNVGTINMLFSASVEMEPLYGRVVLRTTGSLPQSGQRVRVGEAILALSREPLYHESISPRTPAPALNEVHVYGAANAVGVAARDLVPAGYIARVVVWLENRADREWRIYLGPAPEPVSGSLVDRTISESLRYVTSDTLLPERYEPSLTWSHTVSCIRNGQSHAFAAEMMPALQAMLGDAAQNGVTSYNLSYSYRSAELQNQLFNRRLALSSADASISDPLGATLRRVTRPRGSEHQTGMAMDIYSTTGSGVAFSNTTQYAFIKDHGWHYGFVVRYPDAAEHMTRIMFEPWHIRWFDRPVAAWLHREGRVYEELVAEMRQQGARWLGSCDAGTLPETASAASEFLESSPVYAQQNILWLAVTTSPDAVYGSAVSGYAPEICAFLPQACIWLVPMNAG